MSRSGRGGYGVVLVVVLGIAIVLTFVFGRTYSELGLQKEPFERLSYVPSFDPIEDVTLGLSPNSGNIEATQPDSAIRAIQVNPTQIVMLAGGKPTRDIDVPAPVTLHDLVRVVDDPTWIRESGHIITLDAAVIVANGSRLTVAAPVTSELVMTVRDGVFLAANSADLTLAGVNVHASDTKTPSSFQPPLAVSGRPFVLAVGKSTMMIDNSTFRYLGRDWNSSYGLSWSKGATGHVRNSLFEHDFIGVYTNGSTGLKVQGNRFYYNSLYGVDPHSASTRLLVEHNIANFNGRHGIIFSDHVTNGIVRFNTTEGNGLNGIMMDEASTGNQIYGNTVTGNKSDGIVTADSGNNSITENVVQENRIGISVRGGSRNVFVSGNTIRNNKMAGQGTELGGNRLVSNGGEWSAARTAVVWLSMAPLLVVLLVVTWVSNRRRRHYNDGQIKRRPNVMSAA